MNKIILQKVLDERNRQDIKWGVRNHSDLYWLGIIMEELGEVAKEIIKDNTDINMSELVQVVAVGIAWLECKQRARDT